MKQKTIITSKVEMLVVDLPEDATNVRVGAFDNIYFDSKSQGWDGYDLVETPEGNWQHLGKATELTEEDWKGIVGQSIHTNLYPHYAEGVTPPNLYCYETATESGLSLLKANGVVFDMPKKPHWITKINSPEDRDLSQKQMEDYFDAESKVWRNCHVFIKQN